MADLYKEMGVRGPGSKPLLVSSMALQQPPREINDEMPKCFLFKHNRGGSFFLSIENGDKQGSGHFRGEAVVPRRVPWNPFWSLNLRLQTDFANLFEPAV